MTSLEKVTFLQVNIGRGHPFYLDGIIEQLRCLSEAPQVEVHAAAEVSRGVSRLAWTGVYWLYRRGSSGGSIGRLYGRLRRERDYERQRVAVSLLARDLRRRFMAGAEPLIVSHPLLVAALAGRPGLAYQHGELVAPAESLVGGASHVFVPTQAVANRFQEVGYAPEQVLISGLCIEPRLAVSADQACLDRCRRIAGGARLCGLFMSSGAEPTQHVKQIVSSATSCVNSGSRVMVLARRGGHLDAAVTPLQSSACLILRFSSRDEESEAVANAFPQIDFFVGPPHERTNWAVGLGLPMFALTPCIGPFAPLNLDVLERSGTTCILRSDADAANLGLTVTRLRDSGRLLKMVEAGWGKFRIDGFANIARFLAARP